ncbi:hypothetical protein QEN19_003199 [Hanseniaspora menglaensis]
MAENQVSVNENMIIEPETNIFEDDDPVIETIPMILNPTENANIQLWQFTNKNKKHIASTTNNIDNNLYNIRHKKQTGSWDVDFNLANNNKDLPFYNIKRLKNKYNEDDNNDAFKQQLYEEPGSTDPMDATFFQNMTGVEIENDSSFIQMVGVLNDVESGKQLQMVRLNKNVQFRPSFKYIDSVETRSSGQQQQPPQQALGANNRATMVTLSAAGNADGNSNINKLTGSLLAYKINDEEPSIQYLYDREKPYIKNFLLKEGDAVVSNGKPVDKEKYIDMLF